MGEKGWKERGRRRHAEPASGEMRPSLHAKSEVEVKTRLCWVSFGPGLRNSRGGEATRQNDAYHRANAEGCDASIPRTRQHSVSLITFLESGFTFLEFSNLTSSASTPEAPLV